MIQYAIQFHLPSTAGSLRQPLPQPIQSPKSHSEHVRDPRVGEHRRYDTSALLIIVEVVRLDRRRSGGEGGGGYAERGRDSGELDVGRVEVRYGRYCGAIIVVVGGGAAASCSDIVAHDF